MTSIEQQQSPASPAFNYHNRFATPAKSSESHGSTSGGNKALAADGTPTVTASNTADGFDFNFEDVKPLSFSQQYQTSANPTALQTEAPPQSDGQSKDVAVLEAAVDQERDDPIPLPSHSTQQGDDATSRGVNGAPPPLPTSLQGADDAAPPQADADDAAGHLASAGPHSSIGSSSALGSGPSPWQTAESAEPAKFNRLGAISPSGSNKSVSQTSLQNFSRPQHQQPQQTSVVPSSSSGLASRLDSLDISNRPSSESHRHDAAAAVAARDVAPLAPREPQYRSVQAQQPSLVSSSVNSFPQVASAHPQSLRSISGEVVGTATEDGNRERPNSFFGMERPLEASNATSQAAPAPTPASNDASTVNDSASESLPGLRDGAESANVGGARPSSFFGATPDAWPGPAQGSQGPSQAERIAAYHRAEAQRQSSTGSGANTAGQTRSTLAGGTGNAYIQQSAAAGSGRPASIAPSTSGPLLDHSHLKPGQQAALLSHHKTLELYRLNAKKTNDPDLIYELSVFMIDASKSMAAEAPSGAAEMSSRDETIKEAIGLLKKIAERGHPDAQYFLADCYANGIGSPKNKQDFDRAYPLFVLAAKHGHPDAAYRAGTCCEKGWGCRRDSSKALQFYRKASSQSHPGSMYRLATAELNGELGLKKSAKEGVKWLKRSAENATPEFPHALHELALLHERGIDNVLFVDPEYACELLAQAGEMGYAPSAYKLGVNYEYGRMGCPQDAGLSIHMYNIAAQQNHKEACFALTAWYLVGAPGILPQSDTEAYLWAKKAAEQNLAKAEYAVGYFTEMGIGTVRDVKEAKAWFTRAAEHGDKRANQRLTALGARAVPQLTGVGSGANGKDKGAPKAGQHGQNALGTDYASMPQARRTQPTNAPFPSRVEVSAMSPAASAGATTYPSPLTMRDVQSAQREERYLANVAAHQQAQLRVNANGNSHQAFVSSPISPSNANSMATFNAFDRAGPPQAPATVSSGPMASSQSALPSPATQTSFAPPAARGSPQPQQPVSPPPSHRPSWSPAPNGPGQHIPFSAAANYPSYPAQATSSPTMQGPPGSRSPPPTGMHNGFNGPQSANAFSQPMRNGPGNFPPPGGNGNGNGNADAVTAMPLRMQSDEVAAGQIAQRLAAQGKSSSPTSPDQPKKKKGWFK